MKPKRTKTEKEDFTLPEPEIIEASKFKHMYFGPDVPTLDLECWEEELSEIQLEAYRKSEEEYKSIQAKLDAIIKDTGGEVVYNGDQFCAYQLLGKQPALKDLESKSADIIRSRSRSISKEPSKGPGKRRTRQDRDDSYSPEPLSKKSKKKKDKDKKDKDVKGKEKEKEKDKDEKKDKTLAPSNIHSVVTSVRPSEATAVGGLCTGSAAKTLVVDLTKEESAKNVADSKEISFNKLQGKTFPSLVVVARPWLRAREAGASDRGTLDSRVKAVLMHTPTKFTEWLIQQGLLRADQLCNQHPTNKLKLGMYSDASKFPYSGGYVWISECCPVRFVSVFNGSLFEGAPHPPSVLLKLLYHWACQTNVQNVVQWVKVDNLYVKGFFTNLRAICTAAVEEHLSKLGGNNKKIEVGVISLGTTSHDGTQRQVKVEVLGILEQDSKLVRLRAIEPLSETERNYKKRFQKILEPLGQWVDRKSTILTDLTVDKGTLVSMGFKNVQQSSSSEATAKNSNANIMEYLRRIVPRMFQNTLSLLSRQIIQQFLDELVWREKFGITPGQAFDNIVSHVAEQTRIEAKEHITQRLTRIAANPFKNWNYASFKKKHSDPVLEDDEPLAPPAAATGRRGRPKKTVKEPTPPPPPPPAKSTRKERAKARIDYSALDGGDDDEDLPLDSRVKKIKKEKKTRDKVKETKEKIKETKEQIKSIKEKAKQKAAKESKKRKREKALFDDIEDIPLKNIKREIKHEEMVSLQKYYFGQTQEPDRLPPQSINVKCPSCPEEIVENTELLRHLIGHAVRATSGAVCACCLATVASDTHLAEHIANDHPAEPSTQPDQYFCLICEMRLPNLVALSTHMSKMHQPSELPYKCGVCDYRTSSKRIIIQHFYQAHSRHNSLQCPHCLMVITAYADGCDLQANIRFFLEHLEEHPHKCNRCALRFSQIGALREHVVRDHAAVAGALPLCSHDNMIPKPKNKARGPNKDWGGYAVVQSLDSTLLAIPDAMICKECGVQLDDDRHLIGVCRCNKCGITAACWRRLLGHQCPPVVHPRPLEAAAYCVCGFSSGDGPTMLAHLLRCGHTTAYASAEEAAANIKPPPASEEPSTVENDDKTGDADVDKTGDADVESTGTENRNSEDAPIETDAGEAENATVDTTSGDNDPSNEDGNNSNLNVQMDYGPPPSVLNTTLSLDDLAPPSVMQQDQNEPELLKNEAYEQPLATPRRAELDPGTLQSYMGDYDSNLPATPQHPEFY